MSVRRTRRVRDAPSGKCIALVNSDQQEATLRQDRTLIKTGGVGDRGSKQRAVHARFEGVEGVVDRAKCNGATSEARA
jgi:hypothetical protein